MRGQGRPRDSHYWRPAGSPGAPAGRDDQGKPMTAVAARPEFLRIDVSGQEHSVFTGYNRPVTLTPPPAGQTISTAQLAGRGAHAPG
jgi:hypothetical protein